MDKMDIDPFYRHIGMTLRGAREALNLTQAELAQVVGLSRTSLTNIELGRQRILVDQLAELANALHISVSSLIPERSNATITEEDSKHLKFLPAVTEFLNAVRSHDKAA